MKFVPFNISGFMGCWVTMKGQFLSLCGHQWSAAGPSQDVLPFEDVKSSVTLGTSASTLGDLTLQLWPLPLWWHWVLRDSHLSPSLLGGILTSLLDGCFCLQPLMCQVFKALSIPSIHASLLNGQKLLKNKSTLSPHYWCASGWQHSTFTLEHTDGELQDVGYWGDGWDRYGSLRNKERLA